MTINGPLPPPSSSENNRILPEKPKGEKIQKAANPIMKSSDQEASEPASEQVLDLHAALEKFEVEEKKAPPPVPRRKKTPPPVPSRRNNPPPVPSRDNRPILSQDAGSSTKIGIASQQVLSQGKSSTTKSDVTVAKDRSLAWKFYKFILKYTPGKLFKGVSKFVVKDGRIQITDVEPKHVAKLSHDVISKQLHGFSNAQLDHVSEKELFKIGPRQLLEKAGPEKTAYVINNRLSKEASNAFLKALSRDYLTNKGNATEVKKMFGYLSKEKKEDLAEFLKLRELKEKWTM